jgi:hypothetical protein
MRFLSALLMLLAPLAAAAAPITYTHTGGSATIELRLNGNVVGSASAALDGMFVTFDADTASITDLELLLADSVSFPRSPLIGYDTLQFSLQAVDAAGYTSSGSGSNPYSVISGPLLVAFSGAIVDGFNGPPPPNIPFSGSLTTGAVPVTVALAGDTLTASFASTRMLQHGWQSLELWVGVTFEGVAVPEPSFGTLAVFALVAFAVARRSLGAGSARE